MAEDISHRIILENIPNIFRIKRQLEQFLNEELAKHNESANKIGSIRLARCMDGGDVTQGQLILANSDDYESLSKIIDGKTFMGYTLKTRVYRVISMNMETSEFTVPLPKKKPDAKKKT